LSHRHAAGDCRRSVQELASVDAPMAVFIVKIEHPLVDLSLR
jgi:hypothetical protein